MLDRAREVKRGKGCEGKFAYRTRADAIGHVRALQRRGAVRVNAYWCSTHGAWHVGHRPVPRSKRRRY